VSRLDRVRYSACVLTGLGCFFLASRIVYFSYSEGGSAVGTAIFASCLLVLGWGLVGTRFWARRATAAISLAIAVLAVPGYINPFVVMDAPSWGSYVSGLYWLFGLVGALLFLAWLIDPSRAASGGTPPAT
jgi:hypothetical protein